MYCICSSVINNDKWHIRCQHVFDWVLNYATWIVTLLQYNIIWRNGYLRISWKMKLVQLVKANSLLKDVLCACASWWWSTHSKIISHYVLLGTLDALIYNNSPTNALFFIYSYFTLYTMTTSTCIQLWQIVIMEYVHQVPLYKTLRK
jgi:hypothetical protein